MPVPLIVLMVLFFSLLGPISIIENVFLVSFWKAVLISFIGFLFFCGAGFMWLRQKYENQKEFDGALLGAVVSLAVTLFIGHGFIRMLVVQFAQNNRLAAAITGCLSILFFFLIFNVARNFYDEERGFVKGTKAWFVAIPMFPVILVLAFVAMLIPPLGGIIAIFILGWMIFFFGYPLLRGARTMDNFKRKQDLKNFANKYKDAVDEGSNLPEAPTRNIPQISGMVGGWFAKLRAKDAVEIAKAHSEISGYAVNTIKNQTEVEIEREIREDKIAFAKENIIRERGHGHRQEKMETLSLDQMEMGHENFKETREIEKLQNRIKLKDLEKQIKSNEEQPQEDQSEEAPQETEDEYQKAFKQKRNKGKEKVAAAKAYSENRREAYQALNDARNDILQGRKPEELSESERQELEDLEDYFHNEIFPNL